MRNCESTGRVSKEQETDYIKYCCLCFLPSEEMNLQQRHLVAINLQALMQTPK